MASRADLYRELLEHEERIQKKWCDAMTQIDILIEDNDILVDWLNENTEGQAGDETPVERIVELLDMYRQALQFYANEDHYVSYEWQSDIDWDKGERARKALFGDE